MWRLQFLQAFPKVMPPAGGMFFFVGQDWRAFPGGKLTYFKNGLDTILTQKPLA